MSRETSELVQYGDLVLEIRGTYIPLVPGTFYDPPEGGVVEDMVVLLMGADITDLVSESVMDELSALAIKEHGAA